LEDGSSLQRLLSRYLEDVEVAQVANLEQAMQDLAHAPARALLINDRQVGPALARLDTNALPYGVPALVCGIPGVEQVVETLGVAGYLLKPIAREALWEALERLGPVKTVLVVDDEPDALQLFGRMLDTAGRDYRVLRAANGRAALDTLRWQRPDVILLDLVMPAMDGYELLHALRQDAELHSIPVILISACDPLGQPLVSSALAVTCRGGLSAQQLLLCVQALSTILSSAGSSVDPVQRAAPDG
jgi:CheY-like chemotaxis protein